MANEKSDMGAYAVGRKVRVTTYSEPMKSGSDLEFVWMVEIDCD
ncbi:hypothetical protein [Hyphomonas adhaerens]|nr:hypothetical protein [Hyphomonas adhaerens]